MSITRTILGATLLGAGFAIPAAAPAVASAPWSAPVTITNGTPRLAEPTIAFSDQRALLSARLTSSTGVVSNGSSRLFGQQPDGSFTTSGPLVLAAPPVAFGRTRIALLRLPIAEGNGTLADLDRPRSSLGANLGHTGGPGQADAGAYRRVATGANRSGAIAASQRGEVAAVWVEHLAGRDHLVVALRKSSNTKFGTPKVIAGSGFISSPSVAYSAGGDLLVAYQRSTSRPGHPIRGVEARVQRAGHGWGKAQRLGASSGQSDISTAAAPSGRMVVAWGTLDGGEEANTPWIVRAAQRRPGPHAFNATQTLDTSQSISWPAGRVAAAIEPDGTATVAWSSITGPRGAMTYPARVATAYRSLAFAAAQTLSPNAAVGDVAMSDQATALVLWTTLSEASNSTSTDQVFASLRPTAATAFAAPEQVSPAERADLPRAAFNPSTGRPAAVWISQKNVLMDQLHYAERTG